MLKDKKTDLNSILFVGYLSVVWAIYVFVNRYTYGGSKTVFTISLIGCLVIIVIVALLILKNVRKIRIMAKDTQLSKKKRIWLSMGFFGVNLVILLIWFAAYYPGGFSPDSIDQYTQAVTGSYNDGHPFLHTLLFFTLPLKLTSSVGSIVLFQIVYFALALTFCCISIANYFGIHVACVVNFHILFNPNTYNIIVYAWKDVAFAIVSLVVMVCIFNIYYSKGAWIKKPHNLIMLSIFIVLSTIFRHNAILFTLFIIIGLFIYCERKDGLRLLTLVIAILFLIKVPLYQAFNVKNPKRSNTEILGMPLTIMANVAKEGMDELEQNTKDFILSIAPLQVYKENYKPGNFNSIKWHANTDTSIVDRTETSRVLSMTLECIKKYPAFSAKAFCMLSDMVYAVAGEIEGDIFPYVVPDNEAGIVQKGNSIIRGALNTYQWVFNNSPLRFFRYIGSTVLIMLAFILGKCSFYKKSDWKKILLCVPILIYDFGTMLLLTGPDSRFFFVNFLVCPLVVLIAAGEKRRDDII